MNGILAIVLSAAAAFGITAISGIGIVPWLRKLKFGQTLPEIGQKLDKNKQNTPTMGGIIFIIGISVSAAFVLVVNYASGNALGLTGDISAKLWSGLIMALSFGMVGFADDYVKIVKKRNLGLTIPQKSAAQILICSGYLSSLFLAMGRDPYMFIPFVGRIGLGFWFWPLGLCIICGTVNAVNFTDGIDGLCSGVTAAAALSFTAICIIHKCFGVGIVAAALLGGCAGFLIWNRHPAKVFMGNTGLMFLGGTLAAAAFALDCPLILLLTGLVYVIEGLSDVIQIGYFSLTHGKRFFKMAPIHHYFKMCGWSEKKIDFVFCTVGLIAGAAAAAVMYYGGYAG